MRTFAKNALALGFAGAVIIAGAIPASAQFYFNAPGVHIGVGGPYHRHYYGPRYYDYYPGGGWSTWNGCPPNYTIQDGVCKPYRGY